MKRSLQIADFTFAGFSLAMIVGIFLSDVFQLEPNQLLFPVLAIFSILLLLQLLLRFWFIENTYLIKIFGLFVWVFFLVFGGFVYTVQKPENKKEHYHHQVVQAHNALELQLDEVLKPTAFGKRYIMQVTAANSKKTSGSILLNQPLADTIALQFGVKYGFYGEITKPQSAKNPHQFDYAGFLRKRKILYQIKSDSVNFLPIEKIPQNAILFIQQFRSQLQKKLQEQNLQKDEVAVMQALLLGQRQDIPEALNQDYTKAGAIHLLAISGLHVGLIQQILLLVLFPLAFLRHGKVYQFLIATSLLWLYAALAGFSPSVTRAVTMFSIIGISLHFDRKLHSIAATFISMFFLILYNPNYVFEVGFQLSYLAVIGIILLQPFMESLWKPKFKIIKFFWQIFTVSLAAQLAVMPLSLFYFHQFPGLFLLSNLMILPLLGLILGVGILILLLLTLGVSFDGLYEGYGRAIGWMNDLITWVASQESFLFGDIYFDKWMLIAAYLAVLFLILTVYQKKYVYLISTGLSLLLLQLAYITNYRLAQNRADFLVFNKFGTSQLAIRQGHRLMVYQDSTTALVADRNLISFALNECITEVKGQPLGNVFSLNNQVFLLLEGDFYKEIGLKPDVLLVSKNPKVNPQRVLQLLQPQLVLVDGSNYKNTADAWKRASQNAGCQFHDTYENGYFSMNQVDY
ncbi:MAG: ComEC/Rec2 family competence protein [Flavobacteriaceae bacterium]|nr:ComEC/Rec2 family competence protein [Flavobacteriaceae bacterium]